MSRIDSRHGKISTGRHFQNGHHNTAKIQHCQISSKFDMWVGNDVPNWLPTLKIFYWSPFSKWPPQYRTNSTIEQCWESIQDFEIEQCWICAVLWWTFWKLRPVEIFRCQESIRDIIIYPHIKCRWNRTMLNLCGIVVAILKMATSRKFSMSVINSGHHYLPTYQILMISDNGRLHNR
jgi:hypothetical protein